MDLVVKCTSSSHSMNTQSSALKLLARVAEFNPQQVLDVSIQVLLTSSNVSIIFTTNRSFIGTKGREEYWQDGKMYTLDKHLIPFYLLDSVDTRNYDMFFN